MTSSALANQVRLSSSSPRTRLYGFKAFYTGREIPHFKAFLPQRCFQIRGYHSSVYGRSESLSSHKDTIYNNSNTPFDFTDENVKLSKQIISKYPPNYEKSAVMPLLDLAQRQCNGWLPLSAMNKVAKILNIPPMDVYEVASFYTMYNRSPIGKHHVQVCTTTPCMLRGAYEILETCKRYLGIEVGETTADGNFTLGEVECAGACVNAPMLSVGDDYYEDLTPDSTITILEAFKKGQNPKAGPQNGRRTCEPLGGKTSLKEKPVPWYREDL